ncbi:TlpA disulfide reductase family protein [Campylobacter sp. RM16188]|uniref:TlpA family protein disulfide reductase n=1 Tax=Campylobacter sp. RM16188 TaxID=1705725 RepID=UPI001552D39E|nr:TlpA disulfide reductase family protein [Campylobacter sp. RM16188]
MKFRLLIITFLIFFVSGCSDTDKKSSNDTPSVQPAKTSESKEIKKSDNQTNQEIKQAEIKEEQKQEAKKETAKKDDATSNDPFELTFLNEEKIKLQKFDRGVKVEGNDQAILFNFFATWCPPCKAEIPHLNNLQDKFKGKLKIISVLMEDKAKDEIEAFAKHYKVKFDITYGANNFHFAKSLGGVVGIPYMVLYKPDGTYATHYVGLVPEEMLESDISKVIN